MSIPWSSARVTQWSKIPLVLAGSWLLFRQGLQPLLPVLASIQVIDGICISSSLGTLLWHLFHCASKRRWPFIFSFVILSAGLFVLQLAPEKLGREQMLWASSVRLFGARALPFVGLLALLLTLRSVPFTTMVLIPFRRWMQLPRPVYTTIGACLAFLFSWLMAQFGYGGLPVVDDGVAHLFQARIFASGHLTLPPPPHPEAFRFFGLIQEPRWVAMFPPGYPALLSIAVLIGGISLVNPLLTLLSVPAIELIAYRTVGKKAAAITVLLFAFSPFVPVIGGSFRSHSLALLLLAWCTALLLDPARRRWSILLSGCCAGLAFLTRPYTALLWCGGLVVAVAVHCARKCWRPVVLFVIGVTPGIAAAFFFNLVQTGGVATPAPVYLHGQEFGLGFGPRILGDHTVLRAISYTTTRLQALSRMIVGWPFPLVLLPFAVRILPGSPLQSQKARWILLFPVIFVFLGYGLFWCLEFTHGPRFVYCILATMLPLCAESLLVLPQRVRALLQSIQQDAVVRVLSLGFILSIIYAGTITWPRTLEVFGDYHSARPDIADRVNDLPTGKTLILFSPRSETDSGFGAGLLLNNLSLSGDVVVALDLGQEKNREVIDLFSGRTVYRYQFDPILHRGVMERYKTEEPRPSIPTRHPSS